jgi:hypothetical protein
MELLLDRTHPVKYIKVSMIVFIAFEVIMQVYYDLLITTYFKLELLVFLFLVSYDRSESCQFWL